MTLIHNVVGTPQAARVLLLVHGYGADERDLGGLLPYLDPEGRFLTVLPRGPVAAPPGFAWYDLASTQAEGGGSDTTLLGSLQELDDLLDEVCEEHGHERSEAIVGGFSQGAALALALGLRMSDRPHPAAILAMSAYLPEVDGLEYDWDVAPSIPVLVEHGTEDPLIPIERGHFNIWQCRYEIFKEDPHMCLIYVGPKLEKQYPKTIDHYIQKIIDDLRTDLDLREF
jgi:phospholipase/carboxylesterase